ncbi:MAG: sulfite reductase subunit C [Lachnospirales bacterium]
MENTKKYNNDINTKKLKKNAYRVTKTRYETSSRIRVPGGFMTADLLSEIQRIATEYGDGNIHITTRQGFEILGIPMDRVDEVNKALQPLIDKLHINQDKKDEGYTSSGTRNVAACIGNKACPFANFHTTEFAQKIEKAVFPHDFHFKIALTGCPNDCIKARMHDFGIIGMTKPLYEMNRCVTCKACVNVCRRKSTDALSIVNGKVKRDATKCIGCGECVLNCPTSAWTRDSKKYFRLAIMGRTGKKNPRLAEDFIIWADEESIIKIILNTYKYVKEHIDSNSPGGKEHIGYIVDRTGFMEFKKWALDGVELPEDAIVKDYIYWSGVHYNQNRLTGYSNYQ